MNNKSRKNSIQEQKKNQVVVSVLLTESTTSELKLDLPYLEDLGGESSKSLPEASIKNSTTSVYNLNKLFDDEDVQDYIKEAQGGILSEVAYFSPKIKLQESSSSIEMIDGLNQCKSSDDSDSNSSSDEKLKPAQIYTRPLLTVRSSAHHDCIKSRHNNIYISVISSRSNVSAEWVNVCRICHGGESIGDLLSPCRCRGSIASAHIECLERWLKESATSHCELCRYHYTIVRQPKYSILRSIFVFMRYPGEHLWDRICDVCGFVLYTTATILSTYTLSILCESLAKSTTTRYPTSQVMGFTAVLGIALIDFTYTSWLLANLEKHTLAWQIWYSKNCELKVILSNSKQPIKYHAEDLPSDPD